MPLKFCRAHVTCFLVVVLSNCPASMAAAGSRLKIVLDVAAECTDSRVRLYTSQSCDPPSEIAASAVSDCQAKWDALAHEAVPAPNDGSDKGSEAAYRKRLHAYADGMQHEYAKIAELKAIDMRGSVDCSTQ